MQADDTIDNGSPRQAVLRACEILADPDLCSDLPSVARQVGYSPSHFQRLFSNLTGVSPKAFAAGKRTERVKRLLEGNTRVIDAAFDAGYNATSRFYADAPGRLGMRPSDYQAGGKDQTIRFALGECSLGSVLVAATSIGICAIEFANDPTALLVRLQDRFPNAELVGDDPEFADTVAQVVGIIDNPSRPHDLPLDIRGTAFQQQVWAALRKIPPGKTASYTEVARAIGKPGAVRAVAGACAANRIAVAIPCHRVVRTDGALSGYRWGVERKRALLESETDGDPR